MHACTARGNVVMQGMPLLDRQLEEVFVTLERVELNSVPLSNTQPPESVVCTCGRQTPPYLALSKCETYYLGTLFMLMGIAGIWVLSLLVAANKQIIMLNCLN